MGRTIKQGYLIYRNDALKTSATTYPTLPPNQADNEGPHQALVRSRAVAMEYLEQQLQR